MLQFLKKTGRKLSNSDDTVINNINANELDLRNEENALFNAENYCLQNKESNESRSRLSKSLLEILAEQSCICYFVQFLESKEALPLIKFWLDVESFKAAAEICSKKNANPSSNVSSDVKCRKRVLNRSVSSEGYDSLSYLSVDCDSISTNSFSENNLADVDEEDKIENSVQEELNDDDDACDMTLRQSLTDDEKSQMCDNKALPDTSFNSIINSDAVRIYRKYLITNSSHYIDIPATILSNISLALCGGHCNEIIFDDAQQHILQILENNYLNQFLDSTYYCKYTIDVLTGDNLSLNDILYSDTALFYFMEYLEQENKRLFLDFWMSAINFKKTFEQTQAQSDALILYEKYFSLQATCSLKLTDKIRFLVEEEICSQDNEIIQRCFDLPIRIIEHFLQQNYFRKFLKSQLFCKYLTELFNKIQESTKKTIMNGNNPKVNKTRHRKTYSDVTHDKSKTSFMSSQNTLLAMDSSYHRNKTKNNDIMHIDSRQLYNPDLLWRRDTVQNGLTFGRVDALGRYERDFDFLEPHDDEKWSKNRLKKAMRKLVNLPEDKAQEELAWQVAEMIVKDITNITLSKT